MVVRPTVWLTLALLPAPAVAVTSPGAVGSAR